MKEFSIHLKSIDAGNIYINGSFVGLIDNQETLSLDMAVYCKTLIITKEPISKQKKLLLPYTVKLNFENNKVTCESNYITVVPFVNNEYDIIMDACDIKSHKALGKVYDDFVDNYNLVIVNDGQSYINLYQINLLKYTITTQEINTIVCEKQNNFIIVKGATLTGKYYLLVINEADFSTVFNGEVDKLEQSPTQIKTLTHVQDIAKHARVNVIDLQTGLQNEEYYVYLQNNTMLTKSTKLIPYAFLEAIKVKNYDLAKQYLSENLNQNTTGEHLLNYFNNLQHFYYNAYNQNPNIINYTVYSDEYMSYDFSISDNKIMDIELIKL